MPKKFVAGLIAVIFFVFSVVLNIAPVWAAPAAPSISANLIQGSSTVSIGWTAPEGATVYFLYRGTSSTNINQSIASGTTDNSAFDTPGPGTFYYQVEANGGGGFSPRSAPSNPVTVPGQTQPNTPSQAPTPQPTIPQAPSVALNTGSPDSTTSIWLNWLGSSGETYKLYRGTTSGRTVFIKNLPSSPKSYLDTGLAPNTTYYYQMTAVNSAGESPRSSEVSRKTFWLPTKDMGLKATKDLPEIKLSWNEPSEWLGTPQGYQISRCNNCTLTAKSESYNSWFITYKAGQQSYIDNAANGVSTETNYLYDLIAVGSNGSVQNTNSVEGKATNRQTPVPPEDPKTIGGRVIDTLLGSFGVPGQQLFVWVIGLGAVLAFGIIVFGGVLWSTSLGGEQKNEAKQWIKNAIWGLLLLIFAYFILFTINPELVSF